MQPGPPRILLNDLDKEILSVLPKLLELKVTFREDKKLSPETHTLMESYNAQCMKIRIAISQCKIANGKLTEELETFLCCFEKLENEMRFWEWIKKADSLMALLFQAGYSSEALALSRFFQKVMEKTYLQYGEVCAAKYAHSYCRLLACLYKQQEYVEALKAGEAAAEFLRGMVQRNSSLNEYLAVSIHYIGYCSLRLKNHDEAVRSMRMVVDIRIKFAEGKLETRILKLATSYYKLGICLGEAGRFDEALWSFHSAVTHCRQLAGDSSSTPVLAGSLSMLGNSLLRLNRHAEATPFSQEAAELYRGLAEQDPGAFKGSLCASLLVSQACLVAAGNR